MIENRTIARPYARSAFEFASSAGSVDEWAAALELLAAIVADDGTRMMIHHPRVTEAQLVETLLEAGGGRFEGPIGNFVRILVDADRIALAPQIRELFEERRAEVAGVTKVGVTAAYDLDPGETTAIEEALKARFGRSVAVTVDTDADLIGGAVIHAGDKVIDLSVRGRVAGLKNQLTR